MYFFSSDNFVSLELIVVLFFICMFSVSLLLIQPQLLCQKRKAPP